MSRWIGGEWRDRGSESTRSSKQEPKLYATSIKEARLYMRRKWSLKGVGNNEYGQRKNERGILPVSRSVQEVVDARFQLCYLHRRRRFFHVSSSRSNLALHVLPSSTSTRSLPRHSLWLQASATVTSDVEAILGRCMCVYFLPRFNVAMLSARMSVTETQALAQVLFCCLSCEAARALGAAGAGCC